MTDREIIYAAQDLLDEIVEKYKDEILDYFDADDLLAVIEDTEIVEYVLENELISNITIIDSPTNIMDELKHDLLIRLIEEYDLTEIEEMERLFISVRNNNKNI